MSEQRQRWFGWAPVPRGGAGGMEPNFGQLYCPGNSRPGEEEEREREREREEGVRDTG